jgi:hypothetical protein
VIRGYDSAKLSRVRTIPTHAPRPIAGHRRALADASTNPPRSVTFPVPGREALDALSGRGPVTTLPARERSGGNPNTRVARGAISPSLALGRDRPAVGNEPRSAPVEASYHPVAQRRLEQQCAQRSISRTPEEEFQREKRDWKGSRFGRTRATLLGPRCTRTARTVPRRRVHDLTTAQPQMVAYCFNLFAESRASFSGTRSARAPLTALPAAPLSRHARVGRFFGDAPE